MKKCVILAGLLVAFTAFAQPPTDYAVLNKDQIMAMKLPIMGSCKPGGDLDRLAGNSPSLHRAMIPVPASQRETYGLAYGVNPSEYRGKPMDLGCSCYYKSSDPWAGGPAAECAIGLFVDGKDMFPRKLQHQRDLALAQKKKQAESNQLAAKLTRCVQNGALTNEVKSVGEDDSHCRQPSPAERSALGG